MRVSYKAIHKADPGGKLVLAGLANASYKFLKHLYTRGKIHGSFDVATVHPYTATPDGVIELVRRFRLQMKRFGDAKKQLWVGELSLPASKGKIKSDSDLQTTDKGLAKYITASYDALVKARSNAGTLVDRVYQYTWASVYCCEQQFSFTGLLQYDDKTPSPRSRRTPRTCARRASTARCRSVPLASARRSPVLLPRARCRPGSSGPSPTGRCSTRRASTWAPSRTRWSGPGSSRSASRRRGPMRSPTRAGRRCRRTSATRSPTSPAIPTNFSYMDRIVTSAAQRNLQMLPVILGAPKWARRHAKLGASPPLGTVTYSNFARGLVARYGPNGTFWAAHPELRAQPIRRWQIWNEPNTTFFWSDQPSAKSYVKLLRAAGKAIKGADPGAQIVLAGLPNNSWDAFKDLYAAGARGLFDVAAVHPFTRRVSGVLTILHRDRVVMKRNGDDSMPLVVTELSWPSGEGKLRTSYGFDVTPAQQAQRVENALPLLVRERERLKIEGVYWYTWLSFDKDKGYPFDWAGLSRLSRKGRVVRKPAFDAMRRTTLPFEGCTAKAAGDALTCAGS